MNTLTHPQEHAIDAQLDAHTQAKAEARTQWLATARTFGLDIVGPIALHTYLTRQGWSDVKALVVAGLLPLVGMASDVVRGKRVGGLSILVLGGIVLSVVLGLLTGDARLVLLEGALSSSAAGLFALATLFTRRTLVEMFAVGSAGNGETVQGAKFVAAFERADVRRLARGITGVFAAVFFASAAAQTALAMWAPIDIAFAYNRFGFIPCLLIIGTLSIALFRRARARGELRGIDLSAPSAARAADESAASAAPAASESPAA